MTPQTRLKRFQRSGERFVNRQITDRSLAIMSAIERYRFLPTPLLVRLVSGDRRTTEHHLQMLFHRQLVNRFQMVRNGEFIYYLDSVEALRLLSDSNSGYIGGLDFQAVRNNREKNYAHADDPGKLAFVRHELMISRFHYMLEIAALASKGSIVLENFKQGAELYQSVRAPVIAFDQGRKLWYQTDKTDRLPHRPDAFFTIFFPKPGKRVGFFYEADRKTTTKLERIRDKFRAHFQFIVRERKAAEVYGCDHIRAVLIETVDMTWGERLRKEAAHPTVSGPKSSPLFWVTTSNLFEKPVSTIEGKRQVNRPLYLLQPEFILKNIWATPQGSTLHSLSEV